MADIIIIGKAYKAPNKTRANYAINLIVNRFPYVHNNYYPQVAYCS